MAFLQELLLEDKSLLIACGGKKGGGGAEGSVKVNHMVLRWDRKGISRRRQSINRGWGRVRVYRKLTLN